MRIGINCQTILNPGYGEKAGVGHYTYYLVKNLLAIDQENEYVLFFDRLITPETTSKIIGDHPKAQAKFFPFHRYRHYLPFAYSHLLISSFIQREGLDVYHAPANILPLSYQGKSVVTVHDLAIYKHPEWFPKKVISQQVSTKLLVPKSLKKAEKIIAVSESTKKDIMSLFNIAEEKIKVVYEGVGMEDAPNFEKLVCGLNDYACREEIFEQYNIKNKYILFLGTIEPRKNITTLIKSFEWVLQKNKELAEDYQLLIAGAKGWKYEEVFTALEKANQELRKKYNFNKDFIKYVGYVSYHDKAALMANASCFIFPSLYEGFGLPVLEAMSLGVPVITSNISSLPEVADEAAVLVDPNNITEIYKAILQVLQSEDKRKQMSETGKKRAWELSWQETAQKTLQVYQSIYFK